MREYVRDHWLAWLFWIGAALIALQLTDGLFEAMIMGFALALAEISGKNGGI